MVEYNSSALSMSLEQINGDTEPNSRGLSFDELVDALRIVMRNGGPEVDRVQIEGFVKNMLPPDAIMTVQRQIITSRAWFEAWADMASKYLDSSAPFSPLARLDESAELDADE